MAHKGPKAGKAGKGKMSYGKKMKGKKGKMSGKRKGY